MFRKIGLMLFIAMATSQPGKAECTTLVHGLQMKMKEYRSHREANQKNLDSLRSTETTCKLSGAAISTKAISVAEGLSCKTQGEVSILNREIEALGTSCETTFRAITEAQEKLRIEFEAAQADLTDAMKVMDESPVIRDLCGPELETTQTMTKAFLLLEAGIAGVKQSAVSGTQDYLKLKETGATLAAQTAALNKNCGEQAPIEGTPSPNRMIASTHGQGSGVPVPAGKSPRPVSDISGTKEAIDANRAAERIINEQK